MPPIAIMKTQLNPRLAQRRKASVTWIGVTALLSVLIAPCTIALSAPSVFDTPAPAAEAPHQHTADHHADVSEKHHSDETEHEVVADSDSACHGGHGAGGALESDCCCDVTGLTASNSTELQPPTTVIVGITSSLDIVEFSAMNFHTLHLRGPPRKDASPPVYLTTQRIRI
jgi:hypothetical protein